MDNFLLEDQKLALIIELKRTSKYREFVYTEKLVLNQLGNAIIGSSIYDELKLEAQNLIVAKDNFIKESIKIFIQKCKDENKTFNQVYEETFFQDDV
jgi:hypothetical protein